jgi:hypothetical protein
MDETAAKELLCAVARVALEDLTTAYLENDKLEIKRGEWFFLSGESLFSLLDLDGNKFVDIARKRAHYDTE